MTGARGNRPTGTHRIEGIRKQALEMGRNRLLVTGIVLTLAFMAIGARLVDLTVLKAEWSHLNKPARLRVLAERYLELRAIESRQVGTAAKWFSEISESISESTDGVKPLTLQVSTEEVTR